MRLDYWNNPLVVSAFRVRYRGGTPSIIAVTYFLALVGVGGVLNYQLADHPQYSWVQIYFVILISVQCAVGALVAMVSTWQSMHSEVTNRTLDYQRIAALPPHEILIGKLIGQPAQGYLMVLAGVPLLVWCWAMGAVPTVPLAMLMVQVVTTAILAGSLGLMRPLDTSADKSKTPGQLRIVIVAIVGIYFLQITFMVPFLTQNPLSHLPLGSVTPVLSIAGIIRQNPAEYAVSFFGLHIPYLYFTPLSQLALSAIVLHSISRRLISPLNLPLGKLTVYAIVAAIDLLIAGGMVDPLAVVSAINVRVGAFCVAHTIVSICLALLVTPGRECLRTWIWRFRGRQPLWKDLLIGQRSENLGILLVLCALGLVSAIVLVILPAAAETNPPLQAAQLAEQFWGPLVAMVLLILSVGSLSQLLTSISTSGNVVVLTGLAMLIALPHMAGFYYSEPVLMAISPTAQFAYWFTGQPAGLPAWPMMVTYAALAIGSRYVFYRRVKSSTAVINRIKAKMQADSEVVLLSE